MKGCRRVAFCLALISFFWGSSFAQAAREDCPPWTNEQFPILDRGFNGITRHGLRTGSYLPFTTSSYYWTKGVWFEMPLGYRNPWPSEDWAKTVTNKSAYVEWLKIASYKGYDPETGAYNPKLIRKGGIDGGFAFWMPSVRWMERNKWHTPWTRPCEAGRPPPTSDDYTVFFRIEWPFLEGSEYSNAANRFRRAADELKQSGRLWSQDMSRTEHSLNGPITGSKNYFIYSDDGDLVAMLDCGEVWGKPPEPAPNPLCGGLVWQRSSDLILYIRMPADKGQRGNTPLWREPAEKVIDLVKSWRG